MEEKCECLELLCQLSGLELLDLSNNGKLILSKSLLNLQNLKKLRLDSISINTEQDRDLIGKLEAKGITVNIYDVSDI